MPAIIGRAPKCPTCKAKEIGIIALPGGKPGMGQIIAHTPGFGIVKPAMKRCKGSGVKMNMAAPPPKKAKRPVAVESTLTLQAIREAHGQLEELSRERRLADIATIIDQVNVRSFAALKGSETAIMKATRLEMTDLEMRTIYELATGTLVLVRPPDDEPVL